MKKCDEYLLEAPKYYIKDLTSDCNYEMIEYPPPNHKSGRGNKIILKILSKDDKDIILYSYEEYV